MLSSWEAWPGTWPGVLLVPVLGCSLRGLQLSAKASQFSWDSCSLPTHGPHPHWQTRQQHLQAPFRSGKLHLKLYFLAVNLTLFSKLIGIASQSCYLEFPGAWNFLSWAQQAPTFNSCVFFPISDPWRCLSCIWLGCINIFFLFFLSLCCILKETEVM